MGLLKDALASFDGLTVDVYPTNKNAFEDGQGGSMAQQIYFANYDTVIEVHFNSAAGDLTGDNRTTGTEVFCPTAETDTGMESMMMQNMERLGFRNRGVKLKNWSVTARAKRAGCHACLLEVCFVDDADDMRLYTRSREKVAQAIADAVTEYHGLEKEGETEMRYQTMNDLPSWAQPAVKQLVKAGKLNGKSGKKDAQGYPVDMDLSDDMIRLIVMLA